MSSKLFLFYWGLLSPEMLLFSLVGCYWLTLCWVPVMAVSYPSVAYAVSAVAISTLILGGTAIVAFWAPVYGTRRAAAEQRPRTLPHQQADAAGASQSLPVPLTPGFDASDRSNWGKRKGGGRE
ncbi:hypothetical protein BDV95DRAFT_598530 [Massariosphaeria phaeospora]|uniref:Uncharacterized protein n=1 Tax=Massariosphaeria phaeospora TaxID=100035 RepID=A0A7C8I062_9PLEO|nr:hypothetical protein BDV95DRAFT_598530 [Massariosphaeria phaeospora]